MTPARRSISDLADGDAPLPSMVRRVMPADQKMSTLRQSAPSTRRRHQPATPTYRAAGAIGVSIWAASVVSVIDLAARPVRKYRQFPDLAVSSATRPLVSKGAPVRQTDGRLARVVIAQVLR